MKSGKFSTFNRRALRTAVASAVVLGGTGLGINAYAADGTGTANATVVTPIAIAASSPHLRFGSFSTSAAAQTVAIDAAGARTLTGALAVGNGQNAFGAASFAVTGDSTLTYAITLPNNGVVTLVTAGGATVDKQLAVTNFVSNPSGTGTLSGGAQTLLVGATITTAASQVVGVYTGTFTVTVAYN